MKKRKGGFTIIELIVVMTIILILAGLISGAAMKAKQRAMIAKARAMISAMETALGMYQADVGNYPNSGIATLYANLTSSAGLPTAAAQNWAGPYMNFQTNEVDSGGNILDPWSHAYHYTNPGSTTHSFQNYIEIYSNGADGTDNSGTGDDVNNWMR